MTEKWTWASQKRIKEAAEELKATILTKYPEAQFSLSRAEDDPEAWDLWTLVNLEDPDEVRDLTRDRELEMLVDEHIPLHVVPTQAPGEVHQERTSAGQEDRLTVREFPPVNPVGLRLRFMAALA